MKLRKYRALRLLRQRTAPEPHSGFMVMAIIGVSSHAERNFERLQNEVCDKRRTIQALQAFHSRELTPR